MKSLKLRSWALVWRYILKWPKAPKYKFKKPYKIGYSISVQSFCFNYFLFIDSILIIINTFLSKLHSSTRNKKKSSFSLKRPPYRIRFQYTTKNKKSTKILHCKRQKVKYPNDNVDKLCAESRDFRKDQRCQDFP